MHYWSLSIFAITAMVSIAPLSNGEPIPIRNPNPSPVPNPINGPGKNINTNPTGDRITNNGGNLNSDIVSPPNGGTYNSNRYKSNSYNNNGRVSQNSNVNKQKTPPLSKAYLNSILEQASNSAEELEWKPVQQWGGSYASFQPPQTPIIGGIGQLEQVANSKVSASGFFGDAVKEVGGWFGGGGKKDDKKNSDDKSGNDSKNEPDKGKDPDDKEPKEKPENDSKEGDSAKGDDDVQMICLEKGKSEKTGGLGMEDWVNFCAVLLDMAGSSIPGAKPETFWKLFKQSRKMIGKVFDKGGEEDKDKEKRGFGDIIKDGIDMIVGNDDSNGDLSPMSQRLCAKMIEGISGAKIECKKRGSDGAVAAYSKGWTFITE